MSFRVVIPARYDAARLPGKPLLDIGGKPMLQHVHARAVESDALEVIIATDHDRIVEACREFKADVRMTAADHVSGTDRIAEVCQMEGWSAADIIVNLQSDEPMMPPGLIQQVARLLEDFDETEMGTLACPVRTLDEFLDPHVVKVVLDANDDAGTDISDPVYLLMYLFSNGSAPPAPFPACGSDPTTDGQDCLNPPPCI